MRKALLFVAGLALVTTTAVAQQTQQPQTFKGTLIDNACFKADMPAADLAKHSRECALMEACVTSGYVLVTADNHVYKLDTKGNEAAVAVLKASKQEGNLKATVTGMNDMGSIKVEKIVLDTMMAGR
jgi:hypothetical protein